MPILLYGYEINICMHLERISSIDSQYIIAIIVTVGDRTNIHNQDRSGNTGQSNVKLIWLDLKSCLGLESQLYTQYKL